MPSFVESFTRARVGRLSELQGLQRARQESEEFEREQQRRQLTDLEGYIGSPLSWRGRTPPDMAEAHKQRNTLRSGLDMPEVELYDPRDLDFEKAKMTFLPEIYGGRVPPSFLRTAILSAAGGDVAKYNSWAMQAQMQQRMGPSPGEEEGEVPKDKEDVLSLEGLLSADDYFDQIATAVRPTKEPTATELRNISNDYLTQMIEFARRSEANPVAISGMVDEYDKFLTKNRMLSPGRDAILAMVMPPPPESPLGAFMNSLTPELREKAENTLDGKPGGLTDPVFARALWYLNAFGRVPVRETDPAKRDEALSAALAKVLDNAQEDIRERGRVGEAAERLRISRENLKISFARLDLSRDTSERLWAAAENVYINMERGDQKEARGYLMILRNMRNQVKRDWVLADEEGEPIEGELERRDEALADIDALISPMEDLLSDKGGQSRTTAEEARKQAGY